MYVVKKIFFLQNMNQRRKGVVRQDIARSLETILTRYFLSSLSTAV